MRARTTLALLSTAVVAAGLMAPVAHAEETIATFEITAAATEVFISVPLSTVDLGEAESGELTLAGSLGAVTVTDDRGKLAPAWTISAGSSDFVTGTKTAAETVAASSIVYTPGTVTETGGGTGVYTATPLAAMALEESLVGAYVGVAGSKTVSWNPTLTFALATSQVAGVYQGTITHSLTVTS